jgi:nucleotidyltransferase/DNA polymerase involved in DNA repair
MVAWRLRHQNIQGRTISIKIRLDTLQRLSRQISLDSPTTSTNTIYNAVKDLLNIWHQTLKQ